MDIEVRGAEEFGKLAKKLKDAGEKDLRKELYAGINRAAKPLREEIKSNVGKYVPAGYADVLGPALRVSASKRTSASNPGIILRGSAKGNPRARQVTPIDNGSLRHPLFGMRVSKSGQSLWRTTKIKPGFFTGEAAKHAPEVRTEILKAMNDVAEKVTGK